MEVLLVSTPRDGEPGAQPAEGFRYECLSLGYLAASLEQRGHNAYVLDGVLLGISEAECCDAVLAMSADVYGISVHADPFLKPALRTARAIKRAHPESRVVLGGHPTKHLSEAILKDFEFVDVVVRAEGEHVFPELIGCFAERGDLGRVGGISFRGAGSAPVTTPIVARVESLDVLPFPVRYAYQGYPVRPHCASMVSSRGCYAQCTFCDMRFFYDDTKLFRWVPRSVKNVVDEIELLVKEYGEDHISFWDEDFIGTKREGKARAGLIAEELMRRRLDVVFEIACRVNDVDRDLFQLLKRAGLRHVFLGLESGVQSHLDAWNKGVSVEQNLEAVRTLTEIGGISINPSFIFLTPTTTLEDVKANLKFVKRLGYFWTNYFASFFQTSAGIEATEKLRAEGYVTGHYLDLNYDFADPRVDTYFQTTQVFLGAIAPVVGRTHGVEAQGIRDCEVLDECGRIHWAMSEAILAALHRMVPIIEDGAPRAAVLDQAAGELPDLRRAAEEADRRVDSLAARLGVQVQSLNEVGR